MNSEVGMRKGEKEIQISELEMQMAGKNRRLLVRGNRFLNGQI